MKFIAVIIAVLLLAGCATTDLPYDEQFATVLVIDKDGKVRPVAWQIPRKPWLTQMRPPGAPR